jgi:hypothetical protein
VRQPCAKNRDKERKGAKTAVPQEGSKRIDLSWFEDMMIREMEMHDLFHLRNDLISKARVGEITCDQAEAAAEEAGIPPLRSKPDPAEFDPMKKSRWPLVQAIAWIAWRDFNLVMQHSPEYRSQCTHWLPREWNQPADGGTKFIRRNGWFLEAWRPSSAVRLQIADNIMQATGELPRTARLTPDRATKELWQFLTEGRLIAEGFNREGLLVEIPSREWAYLQNFEEQGKDLLKYGPIDDPPAFTEVRICRDDLVNLWPRYVPVDIDALDLGNMADLPLDKMVGPATYVPFFLAVCWAATKGGAKIVSLRDEDAWKRAADEVLWQIAAGKIKVVGCDNNGMSDLLPRAAFAFLKCPHPYSQNWEDIFCEAAHICSEFLITGEEWSNGSKDQFFRAGDRRPFWSNLQVRRTQVLELWPKPTATVLASIACTDWLKDEMSAARESCPATKTFYKREALKKFNRLSQRQFLRAWDDAILLTGASSWAKAGRPKANSNHRTN